MIAKLDLLRAFSEYKVTSKTVAERIGLTPQTISSYVNGNPSVSNLYRIAEALDCDVRDLFFPVPENPSSVDGDAIPAHTTVPGGSLAVPNSTAPQSKAIITCPHCGETLVTSLSPFPKP